MLPNNNVARFVRQVTVKVILWKAHWLLLGAICLLLEPRWQSYKVLECISYLWVPDTSSLKDSFKRLALSLYLSLTFSRRRHHHQGPPSAVHCQPIIITRYYGIHFYHHHRSPITDNQPSSLTIIISHHHQPLSSAFIISHHHQPYHHQPSSSLSS